jgi:hypothetical protein
VAPHQAPRRPRAPGLGRGRRVRPGLALRGLLASGDSAEALAAKFEALRERGRLAVADAGLAAQQFNWLVLSIPINRAMLNPRVRFTEAELDRWADEAVRVFRAACLADS